VEQEILEGIELVTRLLASFREVKNIYLGAAGHRAGLDRPIVKIRKVHPGRTLRYDLGSTAGIWRGDPAIYYSCILVDAVRIGAAHYRCAPSNYC
jgi:hypothetical protein